jgi:uncharacterized protein YbjT (DUF2867 family)
MRTALIVGATGLIGKCCLYELLENTSYTKVIALVRKPLAIKHHQLQQFMVNFDELDTLTNELVADDVFCCLGTTIKVAGSQENFRKVDLEYPLTVAELTLHNGATQFLLVSAMGANAQSSIFYNRVKGEVEERIGALGFRSFHIFQPSLLLGARKEFRLGEIIVKAVMKGLSFLFIGPIKKYKAIPGATVAKAMVTIALQQKEGVYTYESDSISSILK